MSSNCGAECRAKKKKKKITAHQKSTAEYTITDQEGTAVRGKNNDPQKPGDEPPPRPNPPLALNSFFFFFFKSLIAFPGAVSLRGNITAGISVSLL